MLGQQGMPSDYKGVVEDVLVEIDLAPEGGSLANRDCGSAGRSSRRVAMFGLHSHQGDPTIVYILSGALTNHHADGTTQVFRPGQAFAEFGPGAHWVENRETMPVSFIIANIHRRE